jgi:hypothetical protein
MNAAALKSAARCAIHGLIGACLALGCGVAFGQGIALKAGTDGAGLELQYAIGDHFGARLQIDGGTIEHTLNETNVDYHAHLRFANVLALADWHPLGGVWRVSGGYVYNQNKFDLTGQPSSGTFTINGNTYTADQVGSLRGTLSFSHTAPYFGTGWGTSPHGHGLYGSVDLGVQFQPNHVSLTAVCGSAIAGTATCNQLGTDAAAERARLQDKTNSLRYWPLAQVGIGWRF